MSRSEDILQDVIDGKESSVIPQSRNEALWLGVGEKINGLNNNLTEVVAPTEDKVDKVWTANGDGTAEFKTPTGGAGGTIPIVSENPSNPQEGQMWILVIPNENPVVSNLSTQNISVSGFSIHGTITDEDNDTITTVEIQYQAAGGTWSSPTSIVLTNSTDINSFKGSGTWYTVSSSLSVGDYDYRVRAKDSGTNIFGNWNTSLKSESGGFSLVETTAYYYNSGVENTAWINGYSLNTGTQSKEATYLKLSAQYNVSGGVRNYVTQNTVDLTSINTLNIDWLANIVGSGGSATFYISTSRDDDVVGSNPYLQYSATFARRTNQLDVSVKTGSYYLKIRVSDVADTSASEINTFKVWGE